jgi:flagellar export protein FliJ
MAFQFSLATVLRYRESIEKREERALQAVLAELARVRHEVELVTAEMARAQDARNEAMKQPLAAIHLQGMTDRINTTVDRKKALIKSLEAINEKRDLQMKKYQAAHRDRQMLTDMRTRQHDAFEQERSRSEQKVLDDIFGARAQRN